MAPSLLGDLPALHGRRSQPSSKPVKSVTSSTDSPPAPARSLIRPLRLALRYSPPTIAVEYEHLRSGQRRFKECRLDSTKMSAAETAKQLQRSYPHHLSLSLISHPQLLSLITRLFTNQSPPPSSVLSLDLNKVDPSVLAAAKSEMNVTFEKTLLRPGDAGYEYDKQVDYGDPSEPSDWDD